MTGSRRVRAAGFDGDRVRLRFHWTGTRGTVVGSPPVGSIMAGYLGPSTGSVVIAVTVCRYDRPQSGGRSGTDSRQSLSGGDADPAELPLSPYPPNLGRPRLHFLHRMRDVCEFGERALATIGREYDLCWLGENDADGEPPTSPKITLRMAPGREFLVTGRS